MRPLVFVSALLLSSLMTHAQLYNSKWNGKMNIPYETNVILDFKADSVVDMIMVDMGQIGETMSYSVKDSLIVMKKTGGHSPCNIDDVFKVKYLIKGDSLFISNFEDNCVERTYAWKSEPFVRVKQ